MDVRKKTTQLVWNLFRILTFTEWSILTLFAAAASALTLSDSASPVESFSSSDDDDDDDDDDDEDTCSLLISALAILSDMESSSTFP